MLGNCSQLCHSVVHCHLISQFARLEQQHCLTEEKQDEQERNATCHGVTIFPVGCLVHVTSYSPFRGLRGIIRMVDIIVDDLEEPFCFYLVALEGTHIQEPIWFEYDEIALIDTSLVALHAHT
jgi:hypothetical protein